MLWGGGARSAPPCPRAPNPPMLRACGLARLRRGGGRSLVPTPFLAGRVACFGYGSGMDCRGTPYVNFSAWGGLLTTHTRPKGLVCSWGGTHAGFEFKNCRGVLPQECIPNAVAGMGLYKVWLTFHIVKPALILRRQIRNLGRNQSAEML